MPATWPRTTTSATPKTPRTGGTRRPAPSAAGASNCALGVDGVAAINYVGGRPVPRGRDARSRAPDRRFRELPHLCRAWRGCAQHLPGPAHLDGLDAAAYPVEWPGPGSVVDIGAYRGGELPSPLAGTGYRAPSGLPLIVQFGAGERTPVHLLVASVSRRRGARAARVRRDELPQHDESQQRTRPLDPGRARRRRAGAARPADAGHVSRRHQDLGGYRKLDLHGPRRAHVPDDAGHAEHACGLR